MIAFLNSKKPLDTTPFPSMFRFVCGYVDLYRPAPESGGREREIRGIQTLLKCFQICLDYLKQKEVEEKL